MNSTMNIGPTRYGVLLSAALVSICALAIAVRPQSASQNFPTPLTSTELSGTIPPRDVGDARLTTYYYAFDGESGDLFVNVQTRNFTGDIDIFTRSGLAPLAKIVVYADLAESETGRVLYFRKPEKLLLRVQGRTPGDDPAMFRIKFAGSFVAAKEADFPDEPELPRAAAADRRASNVNSVGTKREFPRSNTTVDKAVEPVAAAESRTEQSKKDEDVAVAPARQAPGVIVSETIAPPRVSRGRPAAGVRRSARKPPAARSARSVAKTPSEVKRDAPALADPLASINLVIEFKDGKLIQRPMNEVLKFSVDKGVLTVISKDGRIGRYSILDVGKVTIQ